MESYKLKAFDFVIGFPQIFFLIIVLLYQL